jgi:microcystin-dependent protein
MPSKISIRLASKDQLYSTTNDTLLERSTTNALTLKQFVSDANFGGLFTDNSIPGAKLKSDINGSKIVSETVTGNSGNSGTTPVRGKIALSTITGDNIADNSVSGSKIITGSLNFSKLENVNALTVLGRGANSNGSVNAIVASSNETVLVRRNDALSFTSISSIMPVIPAGIPAGAVMSFGLRNPPSGWIICDGRALSSADASLSTLRNLLIADGYPFGCEGSSPCGAGQNPRVPNLQSYFVRGSSASASVGTVQTDTVGTHSHTASTTITITPNNGGVNKGIYMTANRAATNPDSVNGLQSGLSFVDSNTSVTTRGTLTPSTSINDNAVNAETRPKNVSLLYCIKL